MNIKQALLLALKSMKTSKMRSFLTMLGIIIGVAAVIALVSIVDGFSRMLTGTFESMGANQLNVMIMNNASNRTVSTADMMGFAEENKTLIAHCSPEVNVNMLAKRGTTELSTSTIVGVNETYGLIKDVTVEQGRFFGYLESEQRGKTCVIGSYVAKELFPGENPLDQQIKVGSYNFRVVGVLEEKAESAERSGDNVIYLPYTTAVSMVGSKPNSYCFTSISKDVSAVANTRLSEYLKQKLHDEDSYYVVDQAAMLAQINEVLGTISGVMGGIAGISLLVGGIGIMNIMLVSVTERTKEIGIRKSLGGKRRDIMSQFIIEAGTTSATGGLLGIGLGYLICIAAGALLDFDATPTAFAILLAFGVSVGIGMVFGYFPASKAAKLNPIDALRYD